MLLLTYKRILLWSALSCLMYGLNAQEADHCLHFKSPARVSCPIPQPNNEFTLELWCRSENRREGMPRLLTWSHDSQRFEIGQYNGKVCVMTYPDNNWFESWWETGLVLGDGQWHHLAFTYKANLLKVYFDGKPAGEKRMDVNPGGNFIIGGWFNPYITSDFWQGHIDELRVWGMARTATDISNHYNKSLSGQEPDLLAYYDFNQGIAGANNKGEKRLLDKSNVGRHGQLLDFRLERGIHSNWVGKLGKPNWQSTETQVEVAWRCEPREQTPNCLFLRAPLHRGISEVITFLGGANNPEPIRLLYGDLSSATDAQQVSEAGGVALWGGIYTYRGHRLEAARSLLEVRYGPNGNIREAKLKLCFLSTELRQAVLDEIQPELSPYQLYESAQVAERWGQLIATRRYTAGILTLSLPPACTTEASLELGFLFHD